MHDSTARVRFELSSNAHAQLMKQRNQAGGPRGRAASHHIGAMIRSEPASTRATSRTAGEAMSMNESGESPTRCGTSLSSRLTIRGVGRTRDTGAGLSRLLTTGSSSAAWSGISRSAHKARINANANHTLVHHRGNRARSRAVNWPNIGKDIYAAPKRPSRQQFSKIRSMVIYATVALPIFTHQ